MTVPSDKVSVGDFVGNGGELLEAEGSEVELMEATPREDGDTGTELWPDRVDVLGLASGLLCDET